jgi:hypothetical protein
MTEHTRSINLRLQELGYAIFGLNRLANALCRILRLCKMRAFGRHRLLDPGEGTNDTPLCLMVKWLSDLVPVGTVLSVSLSCYDISGGFSIIDLLISQSSVCSYRISTFLSSENLPLASMNYAELTFTV